MLIAHLGQQPAAQDAHVAQRPPRLEVTLLMGIQARSTKIGQELYHQPPLVCSISSQLPSTTQNMSVR